MILLSILFIFVRIIAIAHTLSCVSFDKNEYISLTDFKWNEFEQFLNRLPMDEKNLACRISVILDHIDETLIIRFGKTLPAMNISIGIVYFDTEIILRDHDHIEYFHELTTGCSSFDGCEKQFILDHIDWLLRAKFKELFEMGVQLLRGDHSTVPLEQCDECRSGFCAAQWSSDNENHTRRGCSDRSQSLWQFRSVLDIHNHTYRQVITYFCGYKYCHNQTMISTLKWFSKNYYNVSALRAALFSPIRPILSTSTTTSLPIATVTVITTIEITALFSTESMTNNHRNQCQNHLVVAFFVTFIFVW